MQAAYAYSYNQYTVAPYRDKSGEEPFPQAMLVVNMYNELDAIVFNPESQAPAEEPSPVAAPSFSLGSFFRRPAWR